MIPFLVSLLSLAALVGCTVWRKIREAQAIPHPTHGAPTAAAVVARYFGNRAIRSRGRIRRRAYRAAWRYFRDKAPR
jgi:hypothetical protein